MYSNPNRLTNFVLAALPAVAVAFFLQGNLSAQHVEFNTRYQPSSSSNHWQSPPPMLNAQPSPWHSSQPSPTGFHQLDAPQVATPFTQPFNQPLPNHGMIEPAIVGSEYPTEYPTQIASPIFQQVQEIPMAPQAPTLPMETNISALPMETVVPSTEVPLTPMVETELGSSIPSERAIPEGYDPAYPIEFPGATFQGYYPTEGGVIAPPSETSSQASSESSTGESSTSSVNSELPTERQAPAIPSVVIEDRGIVMPETAMSKTPLNQIVDGGSMSKSKPEMPVLDSASDSARTDAALADQSAKRMATKRMAMRRMAKSESEPDAVAKAEARMIKKLKQQMRAAELRAQEAEEKAVAIARRSSADQETVDQLKAKLAESNKALDQMKSQSATTKQELEKARTAAANASQKDNSGSATKVEKATKDKAEANSLTELAPAEQPKTKMETPEKESPKSPQSNVSNNESLLKKIAALETAREKQLAAAAERINEDFNSKINAKLDSGKTEEHPQVLTLKESLQKRLDQSDKNIRGRYKRQINKLRKEAAARSRS